jgi:hypothetical protein
MIGPVAQIPAGDGSFVDLYLLRFGKDGKLESRETAKLAVKAATEASDVFVFSHGWNNIYGDALRNYTQFAKGFIAQRAQFSRPVPDDYRPVLIGIVWPSTWFVLKSEQGPVIAGGDERAAAIEAMLDAVTDGWDAESRARLVELVDGVDAIDEDGARQLAEIVVAAWPADDDGTSSTPDVDNIIDAWKRLEGGDDVDFEDEEVGILVSDDTEDETEDAAEAHAAGGFSFDPRGILRIGSVWKMKGRAGDVGLHGVGPLLTLMARPGVRIHLIGHSFGARVLLSAVAHSPALEDHPAHSMLLLQPAVNRWCFATKVVGKNAPGGYAHVPDRVIRPIIATRSTFDKPLHEVFHLALRGDNLGEINASAVGDTERYGALGGYPPQGIPVATDQVHAAGVPYDLGIPQRVVSLDGSLEIDGKPAIDDHGDVNSPVTWWALHNLVTD